MACQFLSDVIFTSQSLWFSIGFLFGGLVVLGRWSRP